MPSFSDYQRILSTNGRAIGEVRKAESDKIMEQTWDGDIASQTVYLYDFYHDKEPLKLRDINPQPYGCATDAKVNISTYQSLAKDQVTFHLQFRPSHIPCVDYYKKVFADRYDAIYPIGLYVAIRDNDGKYNKWLIVDKADFYAPQFSTFEILPCDYVFQWVYDNKKYQMAGCLRSQNSYNSGEWTADKTTTVQDQSKPLLPLNRTSETLFYNQRIIIDAKVLIGDPRTWQISKINRVTPKGIVHFTIAQTLFDKHTDYIEFDNDGNIIGMWADYFHSEITPVQEEPREKDTPWKKYCRVSYSGNKPVIKVGGSYKKFFVTFYDNNEMEIPFEEGLWTFSIILNPNTKDETEIDASDLITVLSSNDSSVLEENQIKVKFLGDDTYINSILRVTYTTLDEETTSNMLVDIIPL